MIIAHTMALEPGILLPEDEIKPRRFDDVFYPQYKRIYNESFYPMRAALGIKPYECCAPIEALNKEDIFILCHGNDLVGSVVCRKNEIDDLIVDAKWRRQGIGRQLLIWGIRHIRELTPEKVILHVADWNSPAIKLYSYVGFRIIKTEYLER